MVPHKKVSGFSPLRLGILSGLLGISCCVTPVVLVLLGLSSVSAAISLGNTLYYDYGWYFRGAALLLAGIGVYIHLKKRNACSLQGAKSNRKTIAVVFVSMVAVYFGFLFFTSWLEQISASPPSLP